MIIFFSNWLRDQKREKRGIFLKNKNMASILE